VYFSSFIERRILMTLRFGEIYKFNISVLARACVGIFYVYSITTARFARRFYSRKRETRVQSCIAMQDY